MAIVQEAKQTFCPALHVTSAPQNPAPAVQTDIPPTHATQAALQAATHAVPLTGPPLTCTASRQTSHRETSAVLNLMSGHSFLLAEGLDKGHKILSAMKGNR